MMLVPPHAPAPPAAAGAPGGASPLMAALHALAGRMRGAMPMRGKPMGPPTAGAPSQLGPHGSPPGPMGHMPSIIPGA